MSVLGDSPCPAIFTYVEGDNLPLLFGDFTQPITGYTLTLVIQRIDGTEARIGPGTIINDTEGQFSFGPFASSASLTSVDAPGGVFDFSSPGEMTIELDGFSYLLAFQPLDFATPAAVPPSEAVFVLAAKLEAAGADPGAFVVEVVGDAVRLTSTSRGDASTLQITSGDPEDINEVFGFPTTLARADLTRGLQRACIEFVDSSGNVTTTPNLYLNVVKRC